MGVRLADPGTYRHLTDCSETFVPVSDGRPDLVGRILLDEVDAWHSHLGLIRPRPADLSLIANKGIDEDLRWVASARALDCGKLELLQKVLEAFPVKGSYWHRQLADSIWESAASWTPRPV